MIPRSTVSSYDSRLAHSQREGRGYVAVRCAALAAALLVASGGAAQTFQPPPPVLPSDPKPAAPVLLSPDSAAVVRASSAGTNLSLSWRQGARLIGGDGPPAAKWFVVCVYDPAAWQICRWPPGFGSLPYLRTEPPQTIPHAPSGWPAPHGSLTYQYATDALPFAPRTQRLAWRIGACTEQHDASCSYSEPRPITLTPHDLVASRLRISQAGAALAFSASVRNEGELPSPPHTTTLKVARVVAPTACTPLTDYRQLPGLLQNTQLLLRDGSVVHRNTNPPIEQVIGALLVGEQVAQQTGASTDAIAPGAQRIEVEIFTPSPASRPATYVAWMQTRIDGAEADAAPANNTLHEALCWR